MSAWRKNCLHNAKIILKKAPAKGAFFMQKGSIMEEFTPIYRILQILKKAMDVEEFEKKLISSEAIKVNYPKWCRLMAMLANNGYVSGVSVWNSLDCQYPKIELVRPEITLKGLEYLEENSMMKKVSKVAKGVIDVFK